MFKRASLADELMSDMKKNLVKSADFSAHTSLSKAIDYLDFAARIFEEAGMPDYSNQIVDILSEVAGKIVMPDEIDLEDKGK